jgi:hypothetical protein
MFYFPQLSTGSVAQYPIQKRRAMRTVVNEAADGSQYKLADATAPAVEWTLAFQTLTDGERDAMISLFGNVEGQLGSFTFLDPTDNLLVWSEDLTQTAWTHNSFLTVATGVADPNGGTTANRISNAGSGALSIEQTINGPGWFRYAFSMQARSDQIQQLTLVQSTASGNQSQTFTIGPNWTPLLLSAQLGGTDDSVTFGIQAQPGGSPDLYAIQVEAQAGASGYKMTTSSGGVYSQARFLSDELAITTDGPNQHSCQVGIHTQA